MISSLVKPKTKAELIKALQSANIASVEVYEGEDIKRVPSHARLSSHKVSVIILRAR